MRTHISYLVAMVMAAMIAMTPTGRGTDYLYSDDFPSHIVLSHAFPSNSDYEWSIDFSGRTSAANDFLERNICAGAVGFDLIPGGNFGVTHEQAYQAVVGSNRGTAMEAWSDIAYMHADRYDPTYADASSRDTLWEKIRFTLDGDYGVCPAYSGSYWDAPVQGTPYLYNLNTITGIGRQLGGFRRHESLRRRQHPQQPPQRTAIRRT